MPFLFTANVKYAGGKYTYDARDLSSNFPFLEGRLIAGKVVSIYRDGRITRINKEFMSKMAKTVGTTSPIAEIVEPNPLKALGLPIPLDVLFVVYRYHEPLGEQLIEFPIAEGILLRSSGLSYFEDETKRILKEQESSMLLEGTIFHENLLKSTQMAREAVVSFEQENFAYTKTSCRRIIEEIKKTANAWKTIDGSESLCEKLKSLVNSLFSFASIGGPHEGVTTKEETELILKYTMSLLFYCNSILKSERVSFEQ